jgi:hypothetical protein
LELPTPADMAREVTPLIAKAGGALDLLELEQALSAEFWPRIEAFRGVHGVDYFRQAFNDAVTIVMNSGLINSSGSRLLLTNKGWEQASFVQAERGSVPKSEKIEEQSEAHIDLTYAKPVVELKYEGLRNWINEEDLVQAGVDAFVIDGNDAVTTIMSTQVRVHPRVYLDTVNAGCYYERICSRPDEPHAIAGTSSRHEPWNLTDRQRRDVEEYKFRHGYAASRAFVRVALEDGSENHLVRFHDGSSEPVAKFVTRVLSTRTEKILRGHLSEQAHEYHGKRLTLTPTELLDTLYLAQTGEDQAAMGFHAAMREAGINRSAADILLNECNVRLPGLATDDTAYRTLRTTLKKRSASWVRILCEVIADAGGRADWPSIARAAERRQEAQDQTAWREELIQALRTNTSPYGRGYFEAAEFNDGVLYVLTDAGRKLASRRAEDERAPTLSKHLSAAADPHNDGKLTDLELYTLLFLAAQLGMPAEARAIYHKLPPNFPDEEKYAMIPFWIDQAESSR